MLKLGLETIGLQTVNAAKAIFQFWEEIVRQCAEGNTAAGSDKIREVMAIGGCGMEALKRMIVFIVRDYPEHVIRSYIIDVLVQIIQCLRAFSIDWFAHTLQTEVPANILNDGEKQSFVENLKLRDYSGNKQYYNDFFEKLCKRSKTHNLQIY